MMAPPTTKRHDIFLSFHGSEEIFPHDHEEGRWTMRDIARSLASEVLQRRWQQRFDGRGRLSIFFDEFNLKQRSDGRIDDGILEGLLQTRGGGMVAVLSTENFFTKPWCLTEMLAATELATNEDEEARSNLCLVPIKFSDVNDLKNLRFVKEHGIEFIRRHNVCDPIKLKDRDGSWRSRGDIENDIADYILGRGRLSLLPGRSVHYSSDLMKDHILSNLQAGQVGEASMKRLRLELERMPPPTHRELIETLRDYLPYDHPSQNIITSFWRKWIAPWTARDWGRDKENLSKLEDTAVQFLRDNQRSSNRSDASGGPGGGHASRSYVEETRHMNSNREFSEVIDALISVHIPPSSLSGISKRPDEITEVQKFGDALSSTNNEETAEFRNNVNSVLLTDSIEVVRYEVQESHIRLLCWIAEGCDELQNYMGVAQFVESCQGGRPEVAIVCIKYGARFNAPRLLDLGVKSIVSITMDAFLHRHCGFSEVACGCLLPLCTAILKERPVRECCEALNSEADSTEPPFEPQGDLSYRLHRAHKTVRPIIMIDLKYPRFVDWQNGLDLKVDLEDLALIRKCAKYLNRSEGHRRYRYLLLKPRPGAREKHDELNHLRALAIHILSTVAPNSFGARKKVHTDRIACADDAERVVRDLNRRPIRRCLLWLDFVGSDRIMPFDSLQDWTKRITSDARVVVLLTPCADMVQHVQQVLRESDMVGEEVEIKAPACLDLIETHSNAVLSIVPWIDDNGDSHSVLEQLQNVSLFREEISSVLYKVTESSMCPVERRPIHVYRDDDNSTKIRFTVCNMDELKRILDIVFAGKDGAVSFLPLADACSLNVDQIKFDYSAFASCYERIILQLDTPTTEQQGVISSCKNKERIRIEGGAGTGKTFVALNMIVDYLRVQSRCSHRLAVLYVCKNRSLAYHFVKWLCLRYYDGDSTSEVLELISILTPGDKEPRNLVEEDGALSYAESSTMDAPIAFGFIVVDEAHDVLREGTRFQEKVTKILDDNPYSKSVLLSDLCQSSIGEDGIKYPNNIDELHVLRKISRSSKRVVAGSLAYQFPRKKDIDWAHTSDGLQLDSRIFSAPGNAQRYAEKIVDAIVDIRSKFHEINLHDQIAIIVPDEDFRSRLWESLTDLFDSQKEDLGQHFVPRRAIDASRALYSREERSSHQDSWIILESVSEMCGLERLIVFGVGFDEPVGDDKQRIQEVRSRIYRAVTRSRLMFYLINHRVEEGWFEWLDYLEDEEMAFSFEAAQGATSNDTLTNILSERVPENSSMDPLSEPKETGHEQQSTGAEGSSEPLEDGPVTYTSSAPMTLTRHLSERLSERVPSEQAEQGDAQARSAPTTGTREKRQNEAGEDNTLVHSGIWNMVCHEAPRSQKPLSHVKIVPAESKHMTLREHWYKKALLDGSVPPTQIRLMIVGPYGMGKTSLVRSLRGEDFVPTYESTEGIRAATQDIGAPRGFIVSAKNWVETQDLEDDNVVEQQVEQQDEEEEEQQKKESGDDGDDGSIAEGQPANKEDEERLIEDSPQQGFQQGEDLGSGTTSEVMDTENDRLLNDSSDRVAPNGFDYGSITMTVWDFAGQIKYHCMHQMFFRSNSLYVLVLDIQEEGTNSDRVSSVEEMIVDAQLWLNAVVSSVGPNVGLVVVGTHADYFPTKEAAEQRLEYLLDELGNRLADVEWDELLFHAKNVVVDNKNQEGIGALQRALVEKSLELLKNIEKNIGEIPLRWLRLREKFEDEAKSLETNEFCLQLQSVSDFSRKLGFTRDEILAALSFLDEMGGIIHCQVEGLKQWVFPKPQDLLDVVTSLIAPMLAKPQPTGLKRRQWNQLKEEGTLSNEGLNALWNAHGFKHQAVLRQMLVEFSVVMDFKDCIVVPALLPSTVPKWPSIMEGEKEVFVETECSTHLPPSLFPYILAQMHQTLGTGKQELRLLSRTGSILVLDPTKWANGNTAIAYRVFLSTDQLRHVILTRVRAAPIPGNTCCDDGEVSLACIAVVENLHQAAKERFKWMTLRSIARTNGGLKHSWCMLETSHNKERDTFKVVKQYKDVCPRGLDHSLSDAVSLVVELSDNRQAGLQELIARSKTERERIQPNIGFLDRWDTTKCGLAIVEDQLVSEIAILYKGLLRSEESGNGIGNDLGKSINLLRNGLEELLQVYLVLAAPLTSGDVREVCQLMGRQNPYDIFLSHRGDSHPTGDRIKQYVGHLHSNMETSGYTAFFDRKAMIPGDSSRESTIWAAMTCKIGVVILSSSFFDSRWCLREFGIFSARRVLDGKRNPGPEATFALLPDAYEPRAIDLKMTHCELKVPKWDLPQCVIRREPLDSDHARQVTDAIDSTMRAMEVGQNRY